MVPIAESLSNVKQASLEYCEGCPPDQAEGAYIAILPDMTMQLMQKYSKEDGVVGVDDLQRWPVDSKAFGFLSATTSVPTITALQKVSRHSTIPKIR